MYLLIEDELKPSKCIKRNGIPTLTTDEQFYNKKQNKFKLEIIIIVIRIINCKSILNHINPVMRVMKSRNARRAKHVARVEKKREA
jgi:hypothetical protein